QPHGMQLHPRLERVESLATEQTDSASRQSGTDVGFAFVWLLTFVIYARPEDLFPSIAPFHLTFAFAACATVICGWALLLRRAHIAWTIESKLVALLSVWFIAGI